MTSIVTERLVLRAWKQEDIDPYFEINQDPRVLEFLPGPLTLDEIKQFIDAKNDCLLEHGYTLWAVEEKLGKNLMGYVGFSIPGWKASFTPCIEIGWRLGSAYWGNGYATEGAKAALEYAFQNFDWDEIVSFTVPGNIRSIRVMEKIGMKRDMSRDFFHPCFSLDHRLSKHVLYQIAKKDFYKK